MPCTDGVTNYHYTENPETKRRLDRATRVACEVLSTLTKTEVSKLSSEAQGWWIAHQEQDQIRLARLAEANAKAAARKKAVLKLTPEERKLLGLI